MALANMLKTIGNGLSDEIKEFKSIVGRIRLTADTSALGANFRKFGPSFNAYDFDAYVEKARHFFEEATGPGANNPNFTVIDMADGRVAVDYKGDVRGIYSSRGKPLAFYRPDYRQLGYVSKEEELRAFKQGKNFPFI